ncbi:MAG: 2-hydroxyglutaryl-CoA dehydratase, partial [Clostridia bacterium]|nr:2-hydroxyglutaryl-CoA dehydratase [Clostridia bacterium]
MTNSCYRAGVDIGSTTVKLVILDEEGAILFGEYRRHQAHTRETLAELLRLAQARLGDCLLRVRLTGSGAIGMAQALSLRFEQEVEAVASALSDFAPQTDVAIELGGEDAKIIYFRDGLDERMNGVCAGGTGSFIDQMASLLSTDAQGLNTAAKDYREIYPIAARCGVFAKSDIQPLINEGASRADLAASIFQAVVNQTLSGLACGKPVRGCVAFLGGPLHFLTELKAAFIRTLKLTPDKIVDPDHSHLFAAQGAAMAARGDAPVSLRDLIGKLSGDLALPSEIKRLPPLFESEADYRAFQARHARATVRKGELSQYRGDCYLGIDAGSTTTKIALCGQDGELLYAFYSGNAGSPIQTAIRGLRGLYEQMPKAAKIRAACSTGYGEALLKSAFHLDFGEVETIAHCTAASFFDPEVDCVLDIGGQDMKCISLKDGYVDNVLLNEACSSGCGSFLENFADSMGYTAAEFAREALFAPAPIDLGTRCTVFMNSNVKQAQKEGASIQDISSGLACSVIKNALFKVIKLTRADGLGRHVVVQGGTFLSPAVLRAFEMISGSEAVCPDISGLMGAFGAALIARERAVEERSAMLSLPEILALTWTSRSTRCQGCENRCMLTVDRFSDGHSFISGNRCEKGLGAEKKTAEDVPNLYRYKLEQAFGLEPLAEVAARRGMIGIPRVLNMYENFPFWSAFFKALGFRVVLSPRSSRRIYELGMESIPSESECYPAKLAHGHTQWLIDHGVQTIFHPCVVYEMQETRSAQNHFNCPIVISTPENLKNNVEAIGEGKTRFLRPFVAFTSEKTAADRLVSFCAQEWGIPEKEVRAAVRAGWERRELVRGRVRAE